MSDTANHVTAIHNTTAAINAAVGGVSLATILGWIPGILGAIAALFSIAWFILQFYESKTAQEWLAARKARHDVRELAKLMAKEKLVQAKIRALDRTRTTAVDATNLLTAAAADAVELKRVAEVDAKIEAHSP